MGRGREGSLVPVELGWFGILVPAICTTHDFRHTIRTQDRIIMKAILIRIGIDQAYGHWNALADPATGRFVYVPIPEGEKVRFHHGCRRSYGEVLPALERFAVIRGTNLYQDWRFPPELRTRAMHLDPDFDHMTYGDDGARRGSDVRDFTRGDLLVFYAGLRSIIDRRLVYALVGVMTIAQVVDAKDIPKGRRHENAHTRKRAIASRDIVVRAIPRKSGLFSQFLPIGEYRSGAYRVKRDVLDAWGGLSVKDGFIQRSARPPRFDQPEQFRDWLHRQRVRLIQSNGWLPHAPRKVVIVHLRRPNLSDRSERRSDPFWEFGSFGCTGCHGSNLMNPKRIDELEGVRVGFAQGGPDGFKLVMLTPPVRVVHHRHNCELRWKPKLWPFKYQHAPLLIDNDGESDFSAIQRLIGCVRRSTWMGRFSSKFRSSRTPLPDKIASELIDVYENHVQKANPSEVACSYDEALPFPPPDVDRDRRCSYQRFLKAAGSFSSRSRRRCR